MDYLSEDQIQEIINEDSDLDNKTHTDTEEDIENEQAIMNGSSNNIQS